MDPYDTLFVVTSFVIQIILLAYFALRRWNFDLAIRWGWVIYALALPAAIVSRVLFSAGKSWYLWLPGLLYIVWAIFGYIVDVVRRIEWRSPIRPTIFVPYVFLYVATLMFYWFPLATIQRLFWFVYAVLFVISTFLNVTSHGR